MIEARKQTKRVYDYDDRIIQAGKKLLEARKKLEWTGDDASRETGINKRTIHQMENGQIAKPSADILSKISFGYRIPLSELLSWYGYTPYYGHLEDRDN